MEGVKDCLQKKAELFCGLGNSKNIECGFLLQMMGASGKRRVREETLKLFPKALEGLTLEQSLKALV